VNQQRRNLTLVLGAMLLAALAPPSSAVALERGDADDAHRLPRFDRAGQLKIVQFTDTQDGPNTDPRTVALIRAVLDDQKPDLVVFTGDQLTSASRTPDDVRRAIDNIVRPVDERRIPWLVAFGNHDEDHTPRSGMDEAAMLRIYMSYPYNVNRVGPEGITGTGNMNLLVRGHHSDDPVFAVWAIDSGRYAPAKIAGQLLEEDALLGWGWMPTWDWIKHDQVNWYTRTSEKLEREHGRKVPSLMFFHIPLHEFRTMYDNDAYKRAHPELGLVPQHGVVGERNEDECPGPFNSGLFAAALERGDVKGIFVGHDHVNDYVGNYFGILLGYSANSGFATYGLGGPENHRMRGARVFQIDERDPAKVVTRMVRAIDYGIQ
jgi:3',5'-cyclic AMP phosphodiesterase CpdA